MKFTGTVEPSACKVSLDAGADIIGGEGTVALGNATLNTVRTTGSTDKAFKLTVSECAYASIKSITVQDKETASDSTNLKNTAVATPATGVAVQVKQDGTKINFDGQTPQDLTITGLETGLNNAGTADLNFTANMVKGTGTMKDGNVEATMTVTVNYQ